MTAFFDLCIDFRWGIGNLKPAGFSISAKVFDIGQFNFSHFCSRHLGIAAVAFKSPFTSVCSPQAKVQRPSNQNCETTRTRAKLFGSLSLAGSTKKLSKPGTERSAFLSSPICSRALTSPSSSLNCSRTKPDQSPNKIFARDFSIRKVAELCMVSLLAMQFQSCFQAPRSIYPLRLLYMQPETFFTAAPRERGERSVIVLPLQWRIPCIFNGSAENQDIGGLQGPPSFTFKGNNKRRRKKTSVVTTTSDVQSLDFELFYAGLSRQRESDDDGTFFVCAKRYYVRILPSLFMTTQQISNPFFIAPRSRQSFFLRLLARLFIRRQVTQVTLWGTIPLLSLFSKARKPTIQTWCST